MTLYEHPFHERVRTYLRLEHLFQRFETLIQREHAVDHHFALITLFELSDTGGRTDLKTDVLKDLERHKQQFNALRNNPAIAQEVLEQLLENIDRCLSGLNSVTGKIGQSISDNEWLSALRNRIGIPGGTCSFDLPAYHAWQKRSAQMRRTDVLAWFAVFQHMKDAIGLLLTLMRDTSTSQKMMAIEGRFQQSLPQGKFQLLRLKIDPALGVIPEISGNRMMVWVRMMRQDSEGRLEPCTVDTPFEMALCV